MGDSPPCTDRGLPSHMCWACALNHRRLRPERPAVLRHAPAPRLPSSCRDVRICALCILAALCVSAGDTDQSALLARSRHSLPYPQRAHQSPEQAGTLLRHYHAALAPSQCTAASAEPRYDLKLPKRKGALLRRPTAINVGQGTRPGARCITRDIPRYPYWPNGGCCLL